MASVTEKRLPRKILWVDDNLFDVQTYAAPFYLNGYEVLVYEGPDQVLPAIRNVQDELALVILDVRLRPGVQLSAHMTKGGFEAGLTLGALIRAEFPSLPILGFSVCTDSRVRTCFNTHANGYVIKSPYLHEDEFFMYAEALIRRRFGANRPPRMFIVHGRDESALLALKNLLQNTLHLGEPVILREQPNLGRTIIEKFEEEASQADLAFVLLTPDDVVAPPEAPDQQKRRARQNVIFELGYFYRQFRRRSGAVILCHKGPLELPSDISGIIYVDVTNGVEAAGERLRKELAEWLT